MNVGSGSDTRRLENLVASKKRKRVPDLPYVEAEEDEEEDGDDGQEASIDEEHTPDTEGNDYDSVDYLHARFDGGPHAKKPKTKMERQKKGIREVRRYVKSLTDYPPDDPRLSRRGGKGEDGTELDSSKKQKAKSKQPKEKPSGKVKLTPPDRPLGFYFPRFGYPDQR